METIAKIATLANAIAVVARTITDSRPRITFLFITGYR
jgi:hypothetical protein